MSAQVTPPFMSQRLKRLGCDGIIPRPNTDSTRCSYKGSRVAFGSLVDPWIKSVVKSVRNNKLCWPFSLIEPCGIGCFILDLLCLCRCHCWPSYLLIPSERHFVAVRDRAGPILAHSFHCSVHLWYRLRIDTQRNTVCKNIAVFVTCSLAPFAYSRIAAWDN